IVAMLAVLKAGGAYVPTAPDTPAARLGRRPTRTRTPRGGDTPPPAPPPRALPRERGGSEKRQQLG
ncbi:hypothetical protein ACFXPZ_23980, partial [Streptomyces sp. NPDC059101]|uniref:hypothetical protein n=1 Tax=Streptomyces sp. NPDC059101 TaxID=3346728 RepID=UPI003680524E